MKYGNADSLYFLGQQSSSSPFFQRYRQLMEKCGKEGDFLSFENSSELLSCYQRDAQPLHAKLPLLVFRPHTVLNIAPFLQVCREMLLPVTIRCGGTGLVGSCVPNKESVVLLTGHLKQIKNYDRREGTICVEPGVTVRQLNRYVAADGWHFPLLMGSEGVAGIAGCLSCHSRGYHQQEKMLYHLIEEVLIVDGEGQTLEVPGSMVCGAEGLWGVIIEIKMRFKRRMHQSRGFHYSGLWQDLLAQLPALRSLHALGFLIWCGNCFYLGLEGEGWRLPSATAYLIKCLPGIQQLAEPLELSRKVFFPSPQSFIVISSVFHTLHLPHASFWSIEQAHSLQLECLQQADLLAGSLHLILQAEENVYAFAQKIERFLVLWADFIDRHQGVLASCHGVGMQMRPYMPPFWTEESQQVWRNLQKIFDSEELFGKERFFPVLGKSLERRYEYD